MYCWDTGVFQSWKALPEGVKCLLNTMYLEEMKDCVGKHCSSHPGLFQQIDLTDKEVVPTGTA